LEGDGNLGILRHDLVPRKIKETDFWQKYFDLVFAIRAAAQVPPLFDWKSRMEPEKQHSVVMDTVALSDPGLKSPISLIHLSSASSSSSSFIKSLDMSQLSTDTLSEAFNRTIIQPDMYNQNITKANSSSIDQIDESLLIDVAQMETKEQDDIMRAIEEEIKDTVGSTFKSNVNTVETVDAEIEDFEKLLCSVNESLNLEQDDDFMNALAEAAESSEYNQSKDCNS
jgi:hypothetical protein